MDTRGIDQKTDEAWVGGKMEKADEYKEEKCGSMESAMQRFKTGRDILP